MEQWEFLLQREGTNDWQSLEDCGNHSFDRRGEVPTGKYRLICRSPWQDREIPVVLSYTPSSGGQVKVKRRSPRSNAQGLIVVMPFTLLQPGAWQWQIFHPEATEELLTEITLGVIVPSGLGRSNSETLASPLPSPPEDTNSAIPAPWISLDPPLPTPPTPVKPPQETPNRPLISIDALREQSLAEIDSVLQEAIDGVWEQLAAEESVSPEVPEFLDYAEFLDYEESAYYDPEELGESNLPLTPPPREFILPSQPLPSSPALSFCLDQDHFIGQQGEYLVITGRVELSLGALLSEAELPAELQDTLLQGSIQYQLRDPSSASILLTVEYPVAVKVPVGNFSHTLKIPPKTNSQLILGEATFYGKEQQVLASQSFMISAGLANLLEVVKTEMVNPEFEEPFQPQAAPHKRQNHPVLSYQPIAHQAINPTKAVPKAINRPKTPGVKAKPLQLPDFSGGTLKADTIRSRGLGNQESDIKPPVMADIASESPEPWENPTTEFPSLTNSAISLTGLPIDSPSSEASGSPADNFLSRLNTLASDRQMTELLHQDLLLDNSAPGAIERQLLPLGSEADWAAAGQEVVVDDEPEPVAMEPRFDASGFPYPQEVRSPALASTITQTVDQVVPVPEIIAPLGELLIGESIPVTVKLPPGQFALYVKFWVKDCQTSALIDGPRMLLDFSPNSQGELETHTRLTVPLGCCRVRLEAIAIDPHQETESRKASIDREVIPPGLSPTPDFNYLAS